MTTPAWTQPELYLAQRLVREGLNTDQVSKELEKAGCRRTQQAVRRLIQRKRQTENGWHAMVAESPIKYDQQPMTVEGDFLALADVHAPLHDAAFANLCIGEALRLAVRNVILAGDLVNLDALCFWGNESEAIAEQDIIATEQILGVLAHEFEYVYWFAGNHDLRIARKLDRAVRMQRLFNLFVRAPNVIVSDFLWCWADSGERRYRVTHPGTRSRHATWVAKDLCSIHNCSVICGHGHGWGMTKDVSGRHFAIDSGIVADPGKILYSLKRDTRDPKMLQGAVIVRSGLPRLLCPETLGVAAELYDAQRALRGQ
ncbi:MAG TPA: metallophosphoesterase family protein [Anaerolineae bacterium]|nr:metallophosphoesterase family protein [Anaerolineae bacterium]